MNPFDDGEFETVLRYDAADTYENALAEAAGEPVNDVIWLAQRGNSTAMAVFAAMTEEITNQVMAERWPGQELMKLRADLMVRVYREVELRVQKSRERHVWRWN